MRGLQPGGVLASRGRWRVWSQAAGIKAIPGIFSCPSLHSLCLYSWELEGLWEILALSWPRDPLGVWTPKLRGPTELDSSPGKAGLSVAPKAPHSTHRSLDGCKLHHGGACLLTGQYQVEHLSVL